MLSFLGPALNRLTGIDALIKEIDARLDDVWAAKLDALEARLTAARAAHLDADISSRAPASTALSNVTWTDARAARLDAAISSRAPASTAISNADYTAARAAKLDFLDVDLSSRLGAIKSVQRGIITIGGLDDDETATLSPSVDVNKSLLFYLGTRIVYHSPAIDHLAHLELIDGSTVKATRGATSATSYVSWQVVEFN